MTALSIAIMGHPSRLKRIEMMLDRLKAQIITAQNNGFDVDGPFLALDEKSQGPWFCHRKALELATKNWHLVLQDDTVFCADLPQAAIKCIESLPHEAPISLFTQLFDNHITRISSHWATITKIWAQALLTSERIRNEAVQWIDKNEATEWKVRWQTHDDIRFELFFESHNTPIWVPMPNLVDHDVHGTRSILKHEYDPSVRTSKHFIGTNKMGCDIDWSLGLTDMKS